MIHTIALFLSKRQIALALLLLGFSGCAANTAMLSRPEPGVSDDVSSMLLNELESILSSSAPSGLQPYELEEWSGLAYDQGLRQLTWQYGLRGDYDINGEVNIGDLTPLGQLYGLSVSHTSDESREEWADGDINGEINLADVTVLGMSFGYSLRGYRVLAGASIDPEEASLGLIPLAEIPLSAGTPGWPPKFEFSVPEGMRFIQLAPLDAPGEFILKRALDTENPDANGFVDFVDPRDGNSYRVVAGIVMVNCKLALDNPKVLAFIEAEKLVLSESVPEFMHFVAYLPPETTLEDAVGNWPSEYPEVVISADPDRAISPDV